MRIIDNQEDFNTLCLSLAGESIIFMDTEFYRRKTYFAKLCLIQIATSSEKIIIDVLGIKDVSPIRDILFNEKICKVFHAPDQDFDIFYHLFGKPPCNVFDTQTAAGVIGLDCIMGYSRLCKTLLNINLDKTMQKANWLERPLKAELLEYAIKDVEYLAPLYRELVRAIDSRNLWDTYHTRSKKLVDPDTYKVTPDKFIKKAPIQDRSDKFKENYAHLLMFREDCAQALDIPRGHCASEYDLVKICEVLPSNEQELTKSSISYMPIIKKQFKQKLFDLCSGLRVS